MQTKSSLTGLIALAALATPAFAGDTVSDFEGGTNPSGMEYSGFTTDVIEAAGGNPGGYLHTGSGWMGAWPILKIDGSSSSAYVGNYVARDVNTISLDVLTNSAPGGTGNGLNMSVLLINDMGTPGDQSDDNKVYTVGSNIPLVGAGWGNVSFAIPSGDATTPAGWVASSGFSFGNGFTAGVTFADVMSNITNVEIHWQDPSFFGGFNSFDVGVDNVTISDVPPCITSDFEGGTNPSGMEYSGFTTDVIEATGGNPGGYLHTGSGWMGAWPILKIDGSSSSAYVGDYVARDVNEISLNVITNSAPGGTGNGLNMSVLLINDMGTPGDQSDDNKVYTVGANVPLVGAGWGHMSFPIISDAATTPAGWVASSGFSFGNGYTAGVTYADVMSNITNVEIHWQDPSFFGGFNSFDVGVDNVTICGGDDVTFPVWVDLGNSLDGVSGAPMLVGTGDLTSGSNTTLDLTNAAASAVSYLVLSTSALNAPFKGGVLVPDPTAPAGVLLPFFTNGLGELSISALWPVGVPSGITIHSQAWTVDAAAVVGFSASNAVAKTTP